MDRINKTNQQEQKSAKPSSRSTPHATFQFKDLRPESLIQQQQQAKLHQSPQLQSVAQLKAMAQAAMTHPVIQPKLKIGDNTYSELKAINQNPADREAFDSLSWQQKGIMRSLLYDKGKTFDFYSELAKMDKTFTGASGDIVNGPYHQHTDAKHDLSFQSRDAEVAILQKVDNYLRSLNFRTKYLHFDLFIRLSKGPCTACRQLFTQKFKAHYPNARLIIEYNQTHAHETADAPLNSSQRRLTYGFEDAQGVKGSYTKVLPAGHSIILHRVKGYSGSTLHNLLDQYMKKYNYDNSEVDSFVAATHFVKKDDRVAVSDWLKQALLKTEQETPTERDQAVISGMTYQKRGSKVTAEARLIII